MLNPLLQQQIQKGLNKFRQSVSQVRISKNTPTIGQAAQQAWNNNLFSNMTRTNTPIKPINNIVQKAGFAGEGLLENLSFGTVNIPNRAPVSRGEQSAKMAGGIAGLFAPVGVASKVLAPVGKTTETLAGLKLAKLGLTGKKLNVGRVLAGEAAQTGVVGGIRAATGQQFDPMQDLGYGLGARGILGGAGKFLRPLAQAKRVDKLNSYDRMLPEDQKLIADVLERLNFRDTDLGYFTTQRPQDIKALRGLFEMYGSEKMLSKMSDDDLIKWGTERFFEDRQVGDMTGAMGFAETPRIKQDFKNALSGSESAQDDATIINQFVDLAIRNAKGNSLKATRAALTNKLRETIGDNGNYKFDYKIQNMLKDEPSIGPRIQALEDAIAKIDDVIANPKTSSKIASQNGTGVIAPKNTKQVLTQSKSQEMYPQGKMASRPLDESVSNQNNFSKNYLDELESAQNSARGNTLDKIIKIKGIKQEIKSKLVDEFSPIEDAVTSAQKKGKYEILPKDDVRLQIDRSIRADTLAGRFIEDSGLANVIRQAPDLKALDQYMIAKHATDVSKTGRKTGRDLVKDQRLIEELGGTYEPYAKQVNEFARKLLDYSVKTGLIDANLATQLKKEYPNYVPLKRIFDELEKQPPKGVGGGKVNLSRQTVVQRLKGSEREIESPIESLVDKTTTAFNQGERNIAAKMLASYEKLPGFEGLIREASPGENAAHTFSYLDKGVKRTFITTPEIAAAAKNLNREQIGIIGQLFAVPTRILRLGATGLNIPFVTANIAKDQLFAFVTSSKALSTSLTNPLNFTRALFSALKHDELYNNMTRNAGGGFSMEIARNQPKATVSGIRGDRNLTSKVIRRVTNPAELLRSVENAIGRSEELTRIQQFEGTKQALLKEGRTLQDAELLAAKASRSNTANFMRAGEYGRVVNLIIPYFNAGIQGARVLVRAGAERPLETASKMAIGVYLPITAATLWNVADPERKAIYDDIADYEKENNIIIVPPGATQDEKGRYNVIKIPLNPGLGAMANLVRRPIEHVAGTDEASAYKMFADLVLAGTSQDISSVNKMMSTYTPQLLKPGIESYTNTNLFTGRPIVPEYMKNLPPEEQVKDYTSGTARIIGGAINSSPLKVENFIRTTTGGVGSQLLNLSDTILHKAGKIPEEQIGGEDAGSATLRRFSKATGGQNLNDFFEKDSSQSGSYKVKDKIYIKGSDGTNSTINLTPPTKGQGIDAFTNENWRYTKAREIWKNKDNMKEEDVDQAFKTLGVDREDVRYDYIATKSNDIKTQYILSKNLEHDELINRLITGRQVSETGGIFASEGVLKNLNEQGLISDSEYKTLKKLKFDKDGKTIGKITGKKGKKLSFKVSKIKTPTGKLKTGGGSKKLPKLKTVKLKTRKGKLVFKKPKKLNLKALKA